MVTWQNAHVYMATINQIWIMLTSNPTCPWLHPDHRIPIKMKGIFSHFLWNKIFILPLQQCYNNSQFPYSSCTILSSCMTSWHIISSFTSPQYQLSPQIFLANWISFGISVTHFVCLVQRGIWGLPLQPSGGHECCLLQVHIMPSRGS